MRISVWTLALVFLFSGCSSTNLAKSVQPSSSITLEKEATGNYWRATWHLAEPAREIRFERTTPFRSDAFEVVTPNFTMERDGDVESLRSSGDAVSTITVRFPEFSAHLDKEYDFFKNFSDGSVAIYTGHLNARAVMTGDSSDCSDCYIRSFHFVAPRGTNIVADGKVTASPVRWNDSTGQGAYIYFGTLAPIESREMISIVDPAVPGWLMEETRTALPRLFALYTERFGAKLPQRPLILLNYQDSGASGHSSGGGTLPGQIQLSIDGAAWKDRSDEAFLHLFHFLAHESVHLWNGQVITYDGSEDSWMPEGAADALAQRTLRDIGLIDQTAFLGYQTSAVNECRRKLASFPIRDAAKLKMTSLHYSCGNALALFTESSMKDTDLFGFWNQLIRQVTADGRTNYQASDYINTWQTLGATAGDVESLRKFVEIEASADDLVSMLSSQGIGFTEEPNPPESHGQLVARDALLKMMREHCTGPAGFNAAPAGFALTATNNCGPLPAGVVVTAIGGHSVLRNGERTWDALHDACATSTALAIEFIRDDTTGTATVPCKKAIAPRTPYLRITKIR
jgi:hypothetical protein